MDKMLSGLHNGRMIAVFPERSFSFFAPVEFLGGPARYELHGFRDGLRIFVVHDKQVDMVRSDGVV